jgi:hypothetical protein
LTTPQAERLVKPTNPQAVGASATGNASVAGRVGRVGGDTETGVRKWMTRLGDKLRGRQPAPVIIPPESEGGQPTRLELRVIDYDVAAAAVNGA